MHPQKDLIGMKHSEWMLENNPMKGKRKTEKHINNWKESVKGKFIGEDNPNFGNTHSIKTKKILSDKRKEWWDTLDDSTRKKIGKKISKANTGKEGYWRGKKKPKHSEWMLENNPMKGRTHTNEVREKISKANSKPKSEEHKRKISESLKGNIPANSIKVDISGTVYKSISQASRELNISYSTLKRRLNSSKKKYSSYKYE